MRRVTVLTLSLVGGIALAAPFPAAAVFPGENGHVVYVSGKGGDPGVDAGADVYIQMTPGADGVLLDDRSGQHRHPSWSPKLDKVVYALWDGPGNEKVWISDLVGGTPQRVGITSNLVRDDRPSWSPDGTRIAYESEWTDGSGQMDVIVTDISTFATGPTVNMTDTPTYIEGKPVWSQDGNWIYFSRRSISSSDDDILRMHADGSGGPEFIVNSADAEYQPSLSPDGTRICYTKGPYGSTDADVWVALLDGSQPPFDLSQSTVGAYNCAWSPDSKQVAYVLGVFSNGALVVKPATGLGSPTLLVPDTASHFDGNPDWAPVQPAFCGAVPATIAGTNGPDSLHGTNHRDVIATYGGNDTVHGWKGNDLICGGKGNDKLYGDRGNDTLDGGKGTDLCSGDEGIDHTVNCEH